MNSESLIEKFIYSCSHDLRAPLSSIQGLVRIAEYYPHHQEARKCLEMIEACTHKMNKIITTLQEFMVNNQHHLFFEPIEAIQFVHYIEDKFKNQLGVAKIHLIHDIPPATWFTTDKYCVQLILELLVSNSIAYHDPGKTERKITLRLEPNSTGFVIEVSDNGKGIPDQQLARIFDVFHRGTEHSIGLGMGLFLVKSLTEKLGGDISCTSVLNEGTTMRVSIPVHSASNLHFF